jgi:hypothetical protein
MYDSFDADGFVCPPARMINWLFMRGVATGAKRLPKAVGPENISNFGYYPELSAQTIYTVLRAQGGEVAQVILNLYLPTPRNGEMKMDRDYLFAVMAWAKPGFLGNLEYAATLRKVPAAQVAGGNLQVAGAFLAMFNNAARTHHKTSNRANYWSLPVADREALAADRRERQAADPAERLAAITTNILAAFNGKLHVT